MSYKSKHTGAQVDEAVSKVLNGEVGGLIRLSTNNGKIDNVNNLFTFVGNGFKAKETLYIILGSDRLYDEDGYSNFDIFVKKDVIYYYEDEDGSYEDTNIICGGDYCVEIEIDPETSNICLICEDYDNFTIFSPLNDYIPNVLVAGPQDLNDIDKDQVLTNIGIDPVVWKYMLNPYRITIGEDIPKDIEKLIWDSRGHVFFDIAFKTVVLQGSNGDQRFPVEEIIDDQLYFNNNKVCLTLFYDDEGSHFREFDI